LGASFPTRRSKTTSSSPNTTSATCRSNTASCSCAKPTRRRSITMRRRR
jgi:hypothetical protein